MRLAEVVLRHEIEVLRAYTQSDRVLARRFGFRLAWRRGVACFSRSPRFPLRDFGLQAVGFGVLSEASEGVLDAIVRHYRALRLTARLLLAEDLVGPRVVRLVERHGFRRAPGDALVTNLLRTSRVPSPPPARGLTVERVRPHEVGAFVELARDAFGDRAVAREYFRRTQVALMRDHPRRAIGIRALVDGVPAGTGVLYRCAGLASLGGAAVLPRFRGRGVHTALIAARVALGVALGERVFISRHEESNTASAHNQRDAGLRPYYRATRWERDA